MSSSLSESFIGALQGTISVLLTLSSGYLVAHYGFVSRETVKQLTKLCSLLFLPCLIIVQMGPELTVSTLHKLWIIPLWGLFSTIIAHLLGWVGQALLKLPYWTIVASGRPNANALPLLLLQSLQHTGVLDSLARPGDSVSETLDRAKSFILLNAVVQQTFTFQVAPAILALDKAEQDRNGKNPGLQNSRDELVPATASHNFPSMVQDSERIGLLSDFDDRRYGASSEYVGLGGALEPIEDLPNYHWPSRLEFARKPVNGILKHMSPPLFGAIIALLFGMVPLLHEAFLSKDGIFYSLFTQSLKNLGELFVALQTLVVGAELALVPRTKAHFIPTAYCMSLRYVVMPALSLLFVWTTAGKGFYVDDKLVWFLLVLIPAGPSAMLLASVAEIVGVDQGPIASYLVISYLFSPAMALVVSLGLKVVESAEK